MASLHRKKNYSVLDPFKYPHIIGAYTIERPIKANRLKDFSYHYI